MNDPPPNSPDPGPPEYNVYRSRRRAPSRLSGGGDLDALRKRLSRFRDREPREPGERRGITPGRVIKWIVLAVVGWLLLSLVLFLVSAQTEEGVSDSAKSALSSDGSLLSGSTILVLGSDARTGDSIDESQEGPSRADTIMLVRAAFGSVRKLSIPRDSFAEIPGHGGQKINAAYALGGPALMIKTVEQFMGNGVQVNHLIEVDFEDFPKLIDALGGIDVEVEQRICSPPFDNFWKGLRFKKGDAAPRWRAGARLRPDQEERVRAERDRHRARAAPAAGAGRDQGQRGVPRHVLQAAAGELAGPPGAQDGHEGAPAPGPVRRLRHRQQRRDDGARAVLPLMRTRRQPRCVGGREERGGEPAARG